MKVFEEKKGMPALPLQGALYKEVKKHADAIFAKPSAYKSGWIVKTYKSLGGTYIDADSGNSGLDRWFREKWVDLNRPKGDGTYERCGRAHAAQGGKYPLCRPSIRVSSDTPVTASELSEHDRRVAQRRKSQDPERHVRFREAPR
jgi:hypothetical protein